MTSFLPQMGLEDLCARIFCDFPNPFVGPITCTGFSAHSSSSFFLFLLPGNFRKENPRAKITQTRHFRARLGAFQASRGKNSWMPGGQGHHWCSSSFTRPPPTPHPLFCCVPNQLQQCQGNKPLLSQQPAAVPSSAPTPLPGPGTRNRSVFIQPWPFAPLAARIWVEREQRKLKSGVWRQQEHGGLLWREQTLSSE